MSPGHLHDFDAAGCFGGSDQGPPDHLPFLSAERSLCGTGYMILLRSALTVVMPWQPCISADSNFPINERSGLRTTV
jgi:hypothetical protein